MNERKSKIEELIDLANLIPPDCEPPAIEEELREISKDFEAEGSTGSSDTWLQRVNEVLRVALTGLPREFRRYVLQSDSEAPINRVDELEDAIENYRFFCKMRHKLRAIAQLAKMEPYRRRLFVPVIPLEVTGRIDWDREGRVQILDDALGQALRENVNVNQIRECAHCNRIFWAKRKDQSCCTPNCAAARRAFLYRAKYSNNSQDYKDRHYLRQQKKRKGSTVLS